MNSKLKLVLDLGPLAVFFVAYKAFGLIYATPLLMAATLVSLIIIYWKEKKIALMPLISGAIVAVFGTLTLVLHDEFFIKIKPTLVNLIFASLLLGGFFLKKPVLKYVFDSALSLTEKGWRILTLRWGLYFLFLACLNEFIWRNFPTDFWVNFKVFGMFSCTIVFTLCQIGLINKYSAEEKKE